MTVGLKYLYTQVICSDTESNDYLLPLKGSQLSQMRHSVLPTWEHHFIISSRKEVVTLIKENKLNYEHNIQLMQTV